MNKPKELYPASAEQRMDIVGSNCNDGLHYPVLEAMGYYAEDVRNTEAEGRTATPPPPRGPRQRRNTNWRFVLLVGAFFYSTGAVGLIAIEGVANGLPAGVVLVQTAGIVAVSWSSFMLGRCWGRKAGSKREKDSE